MNLGWFGERLGGWYLRRRGHRILWRNYRCPVGEIDLITQDGDTLVFVEVKTRRSTFLPPETAVHQAKRRKLQDLARYFLSRHRGFTGLTRFDVVSVTLGPRWRIRFDYFPDALHGTPVRSLRPL